MTAAEILADVMKGELLFVGEYRGSRADQVGYVDKKTGEAFRHIRGTHLFECQSAGRVDRVLVTEYFGESVKTVLDAEKTFTYERGQRHVCYLEWLKRDRGQISARLNAWGIEPFEAEGADAAPCPPQGGLEPF